MRVFSCPNKCDVPEPAFVVPPCCLPEGHELGVLLYADGAVSNRWWDGTVGVAAELVEHIKEHDCLPHCSECLAEAIWEEQ
jgi:hypothetical protein